MKIKDLLKAEGIKLGATATDKMDAINQLIDLQVASGNVADRETYKKAILAREKESTTAMGEGIAIPHAKTSAVEKPGLAAMTVPNGVDYEAPDDEPSDLFFMIAAPAGAADTHLEVLASLMTMLMDEGPSLIVRDYDDTDIIYECSVSDAQGYVGNARFIFEFCEEHTGEWVVTKPATTGEEGEESLICSE